MAFDGSIQRLFAMTDDVWARHANPWSGWSRMPILPLIALAVWSRVWIGWWCLLPLAVLALWTAINPRIFAVPATTKSWMSRGVLGERVWLNRKALPVPGHHARAALILSVIAGLGLLPMAYGLWRLDAGLAAFGAGVSMLAKLWFLDRMVWLYQDMRLEDPAYERWLY